MALARWHHRRVGVIAERAVAAAVRVARAHGVRVADPVVLADGSNVLVHLRPAPVVARVATRTTLMRPGVAAWLARDLDVTRYLAGRGFPVVPPATELPAGPHEVAGHVLTFAAHVPHDRDRPVSPEQVAGSLADLHTELRGYPGELPARGPLDDIARVLDRATRRGALAEPEAVALRAEHAELAAGWDSAGAVQPLHGDAHAGNLLRTPHGLVWCDFEDTWRGPVAWDLACLAESRRVDGRAALAAYPDPPVAAELALFTRARALLAVLWQQVIAEAVPERRPGADEALRDWLTSRPR